MTENKKIKALVIFGILIAVLALFLPAIVFNDLTYINATNITATGAGSTSGSIANISEINDGNYSLVETTNPWTVDINFTNVTNFSFLETKIMYFATTGAPSAHEVDIEIWCETEGTFVDLHSLTAHLEWTYFTNHFPDSMHFIRSDGNVTIRFNHSDNGNSNHRLRIDTVRLAILPQFEESIIYLTQNITQGNGTGPGSQNLSQTLAQGNEANNQSIESVTNINMTGVIRVGDNPEPSDDPAIIIKRNVDDTSSIIHGHAFADNSIVTRNVSTNSGIGYNSFDSLPNITTRSNHYAGYQARPNLINTTGTNMTTFYGFYTFPVISRYNISTFYGLKIFNPTFSNNSQINNSYGIYIENQTNTTNFYPLVTGNGKIGFGTHTPTSQFQINSTNSSGYLEPIFTMYDAAGILRTRLYEGAIQQWYMNNSGTEAGLISFGFPGGNPGIAILNGTLGNRQDIFIDSASGGVRINTGTTSSAPSNSFWFTADGDVSLLKVGGGINMKEGLNARMGSCILASGSCTVSTNQVSSSSKIFLTSQSDGGTPGFLRVSSRTSGTSFVITSSSGGDTSTVAWIIIDPS